MIWNLFIGQGIDLGGLIKSCMDLKEYPPAILEVTDSPRLIRLEAGKWITIFQSDYEKLRIDAGGVLNHSSGGRQ
ncbi:MAG: hypothetical protein GXO39_01740 [Thermotogae bacterium]|nr:hypothetical protein [Thermotogota bacterium]